jgi:hypothetical protein
LRRRYRVRVRVRGLSEWQEEDDELAEEVSVH